MQERRFKANPITIIGTWTVAMIVLTPVLMVTSEVGASGGEQKAFTTLATMIIVTIIGAAVLSLSTPLFFRQWFKKHWIFGLTIILATAIPSFSFLWSRYWTNPYSYVETIEEIDGATVMTKKEYYNMDNEQLRSVRYFKNGLKDSIWTTYDKKGRIIEQTSYRNNQQVQD